MAITILQTPDNPNVSNTNLIYTVSSSNVPQFQYRYIADLYESGSATRLARFKYPQNSSGTANIDMGRPIGDYLDTDYNWTTVAEINNNTAKTFTIEFGEEYGTSYSSLVTTFPNEASSSIQVYKGSIQYPSVASYDTGSNTITLQSSSINYNSLENLYYNDVGPYSDGTLSNNPALNTAPVSSKYRQEDNFAYGDQWWWKQLWVSSSTPFYSAQPTSLNDYATEHYLTPFAMDSRFVLFNDNNERIWYGDIVDNPTGGYPNPLVYSIGTGLANLAGATNLTPYTASLGTGPLSASISSSNQWNWYVVTSYPGNAEAGTIHFYYNEDKGADNLISIYSGSNGFLGRWGGDTPPLKPSLWANKYYATNCKGEKTRFAFVNSFGVWDYYNVYMPTRRVTNIDRKIYEQERINLNDRIATYNVSNRGEVQYYTEYTDEFEITTDIIDDKESQWLREMFESSDVFIQSGSDFIPINILNSTATIINNKARNKNYQYTIRYQFSNLREPR